MNVTIGLVEGRPLIDIELIGMFTDSSGKAYAPGRHQFTTEVTLTPDDAASSAFAIDDVVIGIGFHWERKERQVFRGGARIIRRQKGLTVINDVSLEDYVTSVISSEMSASCPLELLKAHAVISRSWMWFPKSRSSPVAVPPPSPDRRGNEILKWYGREAHPDFDVCADDHCQRYQGITKAFSPAASEAVHTTAGEMLLYSGNVCDARFSKCCGGFTEEYETAGRTFTFLILCHSTTGRPVYRLRKRRNGFGPAGPPTATLKIRICSREFFRASIRKPVISIAGEWNTRLKN